MRQFGKLLLKIFRSFLEGFGLSLIEGLIAFDTKWLDQPDFERRHDTSKHIQQAIDQEKIDLELGILLIYNCYFLLKNEKDLSLKESSSYCLKQLCPYVISLNSNHLDYILNETVFNLIRLGMKNQNCDFRNDCVLLLGHLARECSDSHVVLRDLHRFTNKSELEVDFFENISHLQLYRHARALLKFCSITRELTSSLNTRTLTQFILPLASHYLCNEKFVGKNSVIDAAIDCIGIVSRILPWHQYESLLKFYLKKLGRSVEYQKQLVRVTVAILDAFHYDLSKAQTEDLDQKEVSLVEDGKKSEEEDIGSTQKAETEDVDGVQEEKTEDLDEKQVLSERNGEEEGLDNTEDLDEESLLEGGDDEEDEEEDQEDVKILEKVPVLCKSTATRVTWSIQVVLLPQLHKALAELTHHDTSHKINRKKTSSEREEEDLLRVLISLA